MAAGESIQITDRGRPVARLVPPVPDSWAEMIANGRILAPEHDGDVLDELPVDGLGTRVSLGVGIGATEDTAGRR